MGPGAVTDETEVIRLPNPPTKKWVTFQDWDEEALEYRSTSADEYQSSSGDESSHIRHTNCSDYRSGPGRSMQHSISANVLSTSQLSSSVSSDSSFGSCGEGSKYDSSRRKSAVDFNASFGGTDRSGGAAAVRTIWQNGPSKKYDLQTRRFSGPSFFTEELEDINLSSPSPSALSTSKYAAFDELRHIQNYGAAPGNVPRQLGWSQDVLGEQEKESRQNKMQHSQGPIWPEHEPSEGPTSLYQSPITSTSSPCLGQTSLYQSPVTSTSSPSLGQTSLYQSPITSTSSPSLGQTSLHQSPITSSSTPSLGGHRPRSLSLLTDTDQEVIVETLSTPEISGIRSRTWSRSPSRTFVRNFP